jgi:valyl-tRNA synthetase
MPFLTEELWHQLPQRARAKSIALERYPEARDMWRNSASLEEFELVQEVIKSVRAIRADMKMDPKKRVAAEFYSQNERIRAVVATNIDGIQRLGLITELTISSSKLSQSGGGLRSTSLFDVRVPHVETVDVASELLRLKKEMERLTKDIASKERQLGDETFRSRAPEKIIQGLQATLEERRIELQKASERIKELEFGK